MSGRGLVQPGATTRGPGRIPGVETLDAECASETSCVRQRGASPQNSMSGELGARSISIRNLHSDPSLADPHKSSAHPPARDSQGSKD